MMAERIIRHSPLMFRAFFRLLLPPLLTLNMRHNGVDEQLAQKNAYCTLGVAVWIKRER